MTHHALDIATTTPRRRPEQLIIPEVLTPLRVLSLGAGVQSTTLLLLSAHGRLPKLDAAIFADTGWEPATVYAHLERLEREVAAPAGIPVYRVSRGHIRNDALNAAARYAQMPLYIRGHDGSEGMLRRACTAEYKIAALKPQVRQLLGYEHPRRVPLGVYSDQWIGISSDESSRAARIAEDVSYMKHRFPLLFLPGGTGRARLGWTRTDCERYLAAHGFEATPRSVCIGCPRHDNAYWRDMRDNRPDDWADALDFDRRIRHGAARALDNGQLLRGEAFLHASRVPLDQAPIDHVTGPEWKSRQIDLFDALADEQVRRGCSPWGCSGEDDETDDGWAGAWELALTS
jgi:3'-phosphoadenosine 5'-phosphosulfate sulfotransferase (PAPS reductase)/FAD synthetase